MLLLAVWRIQCIGLGPDPDTDAYGHYVIARQFLETPFDLQIHWVWLPLYHLLLAAGVAVGATLDHVRYANAVLSAGTPILLWWGLGRLAQQHQPDGPRGLPALAALFAAAAPIAIVMGTTAQPESCFALLLLAAALGLTLGRFGWAALALAALVLLRYEAWAAAASVGAVLLWRRLRGAPLSRGALACGFAPLLSVGAWAVLRRLDGAIWFDFLRKNQSFAEAARAHSAAPLVNWPELARALEAAPLGAWLLALGCLLCGVGRMWRATGGWFVVLPLSIAGFLALGWVTRSHLGLARHWVGLVPFAATAVAYGIAQLSEWLGRLRTQARGPVFALLGALALGLELRSLELPLAHWRERTAAALPDRRAAGRFLRSLPASALILCDDAPAEVLSELPRARFARDYLGADAVGEVQKWARSRDVVVLSSVERLSKALPLGEVVFGDPSSAGLIGLHVPQGG
ncbi:MAG: hypothetical protein ABI895_36055 [Deltaproteobacteria bacterium]